MIPHSIEHRFSVMPIGTELLSGEFRFAVLGHVAVIRRGLTFHQAHAYAEKLNQALDEMDELAGFKAKSPKQMDLCLAPIILGRNGQPLSAKAA